MRSHRALAAFTVLLLCASTVTAQRPAAEVTDAVWSYRLRHELQILQQLVSLVGLANAAANLEDMDRNANRLLKLFEERGFSTELFRAEGAPPAVFAERTTSGAEKTVVFYAHYDGQPVVPELWASDPYTVVVRKGRLEDGADEIPLTSLRAPVNPEWRLYGRSTSDDKVSIVALLAAIDALDKAEIAPSVNLKILLDGEEERGSPHMAQILQANRDRLDADLWIFCDGPMHQTRLPQVVYGVRGVTSVQMTAYGAAVGLHSGHYGNWAPDPGMQLARLMSSLRDADGNILIDGIDDLVRPLGWTAAEAIANAPDVDADLKRDLDLAWSEGEPTPLAHRITRPAINLLGFRVGQIGPKTKNAIPPTARAAVGFRLVPDVTPERLKAAVEDHIRLQGFTVLHEPPGEVDRHEKSRIVYLAWKEGYPALWTDMDLPISKAVARVVDEAVEGPIVLTPSLGGSLPLHVFSNILGEPPIIVVPIANHDNNQHAPNENLRIKNLWMGLEIYAALMARL
jgi:acetylornithine deacetylase/succinyl-diaminopimelate desuccinylase-like protein